MKWTKEDIDFLEANYPSNPNMDGISGKLGRSIRSVQHKGIRLGISRPRFPSNKPSQRQPSKMINKRHYDKHKEGILERKRLRRKKFNREVKSMLGGKCSKCGYSKCFAALDFHHKFGKKENTLAFLIKNESKQKTLKEIKKCILLCANCHREVHNPGCVA